MGKLGSSGYGKGDTGGSCGDYEAGYSHGFGPKMQDMHESAIQRASGSRVAAHANKLQGIANKRVRRRAKKGLSDSSPKGDQIQSLATRAKQNAHRKGAWGMNTKKTKY